MVVASDGGGECMEFVIQLQYLAELTVRRNIGIKVRPLTPQHDSFGWRNGDCEWCAMRLYACSRLSLRQEQLPIGRFINGNDMHSVPLLW